MISAPSGKRACLALFSVQWSRRFANSSRTWAKTDSSMRRDRPKALAMAAVVMSSAVGPRPPVAITASARASRKSRASWMALSSSPTDNIAATGQPCSCMARAISAELVSCIRPVVNSFPIVNMPIFIIYLHTRQNAARQDSATPQAAPQIPPRWIKSCRTALA